MGAQLEYLLLNVAGSLLASAMPSKNISKSAKRLLKEPTLT